jgi:AcrR family transcriptional regulator
MTEVRPRGRRPGRVDTRGEILEAALSLFCEIGYEKTSLRAVAREAGVDAALVHHYFDDKADLFAAAVLALQMPEPTAIVERILDGPRGEVGKRAIAAVVDAWKLPGARERFAAIVRAGVNEPEARRPLSEYLSTEIYTKVAEQLGHTNAAQRGQLAVSLLLGFDLARFVLKLPHLVELSDQDLINAVGPAMQVYLAESW